MPKDFTEVTKTIMQIFQHVGRILNIFKNKVRMVWDSVVALGAICINDLLARVAVGGFLLVVIMAFIIGGGNSSVLWPALLIMSAFIFVLIIIGGFFNSMSLLKGLGWYFAKWNCKFWSVMLFLLAVITGFVSFLHVWFAICMGYAWVLEDPYARRHQVDLLLPLIKGVTTVYVPLVERWITFLEERGFNLEFIIDLSLGQIFLLIALIFFVITVVLIILNAVVDAGLRFYNKQCDIFLSWGDKIDKVFIQQEETAKDAAPRTLGGKLFRALVRFLAIKYHQKKKNEEAEQARDAEKKTAESKRIRYEMGKKKTWKDVFKEDLDDD